jgi:hypothetical protein
VVAQSAQLGERLSVLVPIADRLLPRDELHDARHRAATKHFMTIL